MPQLGEDSVQILLASTKRKSVEDALLWLSEGRPYLASSQSALLPALVEAAELSLTAAAGALRSVTRKTLASNLDTSTSLVETDRVLSAAECDAALADISSRTFRGSLSAVTPGVLLDVHSRHPGVIEVYAQIAGLSYRELRARCALLGETLPVDPAGRWTTAQLGAVIAAVGAIVTEPAPVADNRSVTAQPIELLLAGDDARGWALVDGARASGVSYGQLIAQRLVGSSWGAHRNGTANAFRVHIAAQLTTLLDSAGVKYLTTMAGHHSQVGGQYLARLVGVDAKLVGQLAVVTKNAADKPALAVMLAIANDGGTARKTAATLQSVPAMLRIDSAIVLAGQGWSVRGETDTLIRAFSGRAYGDGHLSELVAAASQRSQ